MKQFSTVVNTVLACMLIFILFSVGLRVSTSVQPRPPRLPNQPRRISPPYVTPAAPSKSAGWRWSM